MTSLFQVDKRDEALERLAVGIVWAARNCVTVTKKINLLCQNPEDYPNPSDLMADWIEHLFTNQFHYFVDEKISPSIISTGNEEFLSEAFFCYLVSLTPFFYNNKPITSPHTTKPKKYGWTKNDYKDLTIKLLYKQFYSDWDNWDGAAKLKHGYALELKTKKVTEAIAVSSKADSALWNRQKKIDDIVFSTDLRLAMKKAIPLYKHQHQADLFIKYTDEFISALPTAYNFFDDKFYEAGTYLHKYFQWSSK